MSSPVAATSRAAAAAGWTASRCRPQVRGNGVRGIGTAAARLHLAAKHTA